VICLFFGLATPFIIRKEENGYIVIGDCYIQGLMNGEATKVLEDGRVDITVSFDMSLMLLSRDESNLVGID
jgi:hypothetical protein